MSALGHHGSGKFIGQGADTPSYLAAALRCFVRDGVDGASVRLIAQEAGFTDAALFKHFKSKEALALHLFECCHRRLSGVVASTNSLAFAAKFERCLKQYLAAFDDALDAWLYLHDNHYRFWASVPSATRKLSLLRSMESLIAEGKAAGVFGGDVQPALAAGAVIGTLAQIARMLHFGELERPATALLPEVLSLLRKVLQ